MSRDFHGKNSDMISIPKRRRYRRKGHKIMGRHLPVARNMFQDSTNILKQNTI